MAATLLTGFLAFLMGWLAAQEGWPYPTQPEGGVNCRGLSPIINPHGPSHPLRVLCWTGCDRGGGYPQPQAPLSLTG